MFVDSDSLQSLLCSLNGFKEKNTKLLKEADKTLHFRMFEYVEMFTINFCKLLKCSFFPILFFAVVIL